MPETDLKNKSRSSAKNEALELVLTVQSDCLLSGASQALLEELKQQLTVKNPKYQDALKYGRWVGKKIKKELLFYSISPSGIRLPRGFARQAVEMCRKYMGQTPRIVDQRRLLPEMELHFKGTLHPYQERAVADILAKQFGVLEAGTGSGKTVMALAVMAARKQPTIIIVHTKELFFQWCERIKEFLGIDPGMIGSGHYDLQPVTVAIVNSARKRLEEIIPLFGQVCVDECHRVPSALFTEVVQKFDSRFMLGLSATAFRREDGLTCLIHLFMGDPAHKVNRAELEETGMVLKPEFIQRLTEFQYTFRDDYQGLLTALTLDEARNRQIAADVVTEARQNPGTILLVSDRIAHCEILADLLRQEGLKVALLTGRLSGKERGETVRLVRDNALQVLVSTLQLIGEGFDCPGLTTLFITTPIRFSGRLLQVVGRILRPAAGKQPRVIDYVDPVGVLQSSAQIRRKSYQL